MYQLEPLEGLGILRLSPQDVHDRIYQFRAYEWSAQILISLLYKTAGSDAVISLTLSIVSFRPVVPRSTLTVNKGIWPEEVRQRS